MLVFPEGLWQYWLGSETASAVTKGVQLLLVLALVGQIIVSLERALCQVSFASYGLSFHSRYLANIAFTTNAVGVIEKGYKQVSNPICK